ncbi:MAG: tetratricopeptide repeat protein, partial [Candidatus Latescibacteria bacterium]|nr:tetratricopeptide repeat protein [Candidatus Latescibacterota bacterium]
QNNLGVVLVKQEKFDEAIAHFREALRIDPEHVNARNNLQVLMKQPQ